MVKDDISSRLAEKIINPRISIIIPYYQQFVYLADCLTSIIAQSLEYWEAIIVEDGSSDTEQICALLDSLGDSRIRLIKHEVNKGLAASRNTGAHYATSELLVFVDADDLLAPNFCECMVTLFDENPHLDIAFSLIELFGEGSGVDHLRGNKTELQYQLRFWLPGAGAVMRRSVWEHIGGYNESALLRWGMEDRDFWIASIPLDLSIVQVIQPLYKWRRYGGSMSLRQQPRLYQLYRFIGRRHKRTLQRIGVYHEFIAEGYFQSARYFDKQKNHLKTLRLAISGLRYQPSHRKLRSLIVHNLLPHPMYNIIMSLRKALCVECSHPKNYLD